MQSSYRRPRPKSLALPSSTSGQTPTGGRPPLTSILRSRVGLSMDSPAGDLMTTGGSAPFHHTSSPRAEEEAGAYRRRLESYRQAQHQQALLVARLQSKLLQYKQRCTDLESRLGHTIMLRPEELQYGSPIKDHHLDFPTPTGGPPHRSSGGGGGGVVFAPTQTPPTPTAMDLDDALWKLEQERVRNESLMQLNRDLRNELDETRKMNNALSTDLGKLSDDWDKLARQMGERENLWKAEEQAYSDYYASEHTKLLALWKKVAGLKRDFAEVKGATGRDLTQLKNSLGRVANNVATGVITATASTPSPQQEAEQTAFIAQLTHEITMAQNTQENLRKQLKDRDDKVTLLESTLTDLDSKTTTLEQELNRVSTQELGLLQNSLREIAKLLLNDYEQHGTEGVDATHDLHLSSTPAIFIYDESGENPTVFAESIVSAVQAALNKRQLQIHSLQVSLNSTKEQSMVSRGHVESLELEVTKDEDKIRQLAESCEKLKDSLENIRIERDTAQRALDNLKNEKNILEQQRKTLASELEATIKVKTSLSTNLMKCEKSLEAARTEGETLTGELDKTRDELNVRLTALKLEQDLTSKLREQLSNLGEDKERNTLENKTLKNSLNEVTSKYEDLSFQFERSEDSLKKWKMDAEILSEKLRSSTDRSDLVEKEKRKWVEKSRSLEDAKVSLETELTDARNDLAALRREILESERIRTDLEAKIEREVIRGDGADNRRAVLESQLESQRDEYLREMGILSERIEVLTEELNQARRDLEETFQVVERTKADLANAERLHMEAIHVIETKEGVIKNLSGILDKTKDEKISLEELEQNLKLVLLERDKRIESLDKQLSDMKNKTGNEAAALKDRLTRTENEMKSQKEKMDSEKVSLESKFTLELNTLKASSTSNEEKLKSDCEEKLKSLRTELESDKKQDGNKLNGEINSLRSQIESMRVQYEEALLRAENDKQQGLLLAQQDQQGLSDKIRLLERELEDLKSDKDRIKRECEQKCSHEKSSSAALRSEIIKIRNELENTKQDGLDTLKQIELRISEVERDREAALLHVEELRNKLRSVEERESELKRELVDVSRKLKDSENSGDYSKKEIVELRRTLSELATEKEKTNSLLENLKDELSRREGELTNTKKELARTTTAVKNLERVKTQLEGDVGGLTIKLDSVGKEKSEHSRLLEEMGEQLSQYKSMVGRLDAEVNELKVKLDAESERRDEAEAQWRNTKKMLEEAEGQLGLARSEEERLSVKLADAEERYGSREGQFIAMAEENKLREKKLMEEKHNLNICLNSVQQQMEHFSNKLSSAESKLKVLTDEKSELEQTKKAAESKLSQISSGFKRLGLAGSIFDSPEAARRAMATLQTQMAALQQDRDTVATQLSATKDALSSLEMVKTQLEDQISALSRNLSSSKADLKGKESSVMTLEKDLALRSGEISRLADKVRELEDAMKARDDSVRVLKGEKEALRDDHERGRAKWEESKSQNDSRLAKAEVNMRALEGDLNRMALVLQQKEGHISALEEKCNGMARSNADLEERTASLTMTVEQLNISLEKSAQAESDWKDKYHSVSRNASENSAQNSALGEKLRSLQREKAMLEQERANLGEKWEAATAALQDFKRQVALLSDKNQKLRLEAEDMTRNAIDKQLRMALAESGKDDMKSVISDKLELQRKVDSLVDKIRDLERENRELERLKDSVAVKNVAARSPVPTMMRDNTIAVLEEENSDLRRKISKMDAEIRDMERRHVKHVADVTLQVKQERDFELERARAAKLQAERLLEAREGNYRQQIQRLEQQIANLKEQLAEEIRRRQTFLSRSFRTGQEIRSLRQTLGDSLRNVSMDPSPLTMDNETRRLDTTLDLHKSASQSSLLSPSQMRDSSPGGYKSRDLSTPIPKH
ncbi:rootletin isoform X2 [Folsomia candida]|uniref:rootletin isoform X2 n=1 Tax=Folsomia candida TaxID=158441 RepID=UPI000B8EED86|nr:rootletin isoform X2 [Folsomia candida]